MENTIIVFFGLWQYPGTYMSIKKETGIER